MANLVFDDGLSKGLSIGGGTWSAVHMDRFFGGSCIWPGFAATDNGDTGTYGILSVGFEGTQISFFGNTPPAKASQNILVSIDGGVSYETFYGDTAPPTALRWYQSPVLPDGNHTINIGHIAGTSLDYMVIAAGQNTPLTGQNLIVDDNDPAITYEGNWALNEGRFTLQDNPRQSFPHGNATHQSSSKGSAATFMFSGRNVAVYSVFDWSHLGSVNVTYTIDDTVSQTKTHGVTPTTQEFRDGVLQRANVLLFSSNVTPGDHKLRMEVTGSTNQTALVLDYIIYSPSFATLASKPNLSPPPSSSSSSGTGSTPSSSTDSSLGASAGKSTPVGPIVGGVVGGVAVVALLLLLVLFRKRLSKRVSSPASSTQPSGRDAALSVEPFTSTVPSTAVTYATNSMHRKPVTPVFPETLTHFGTISTSGSDAASTIGFIVPETPRPDMSQQKSPRSLSSAGLNNLTLAPLRREYVQQQDAGPVGRGGAGVFRGRMQRLQELVTELNKAIAGGGEDSVEVAELKGRIAELTREDAGGDAGGREQERRQSVATTAVLPPYEPRRD